jgi:hypothetical protein
MHPKFPHEKEILGAFSVATQVASRYNRGSPSYTFVLTNTLAGVVNSTRDDFIPPQEVYEVLLASKLPFSTSIAAEFAHQTKAEVLRDCESSHSERSQNPTFRNYYSRR